MIVQTVSSAQLWSRNTHHGFWQCIWQMHFWKSSNDSMHSSLVRGFYSWKEARGITSYHQPRSQCALLFCIVFYLLVRAGLSSAVSCSLGCSCAAQHAFLGWSIPAMQREFPVSPLQLASPVCVPPQVIPFLLKHLHPSDVCRQLSHHFSSPHPHPGLLAKLYIFSSFNLSS